MSKYAVVAWAAEEARDQGNSDILFVTNDKDEAIRLANRAFDENAAVEVIDQENYDAVVVGLYSDEEE